MLEQLRVFFPQVALVKPRSSRPASAEHFVVCRGYAPPAGYEPVMSNAVLVTNSTITGINRHIEPYIVCGDLRAADGPIV